MIAQLADELGAIVKPAVPGDNDPGAADVRLRFAARFFRGVKGPIQDVEV